MIEGAEETFRHRSYLVNEPFRLSRYSGLAVLVPTVQTFIIRQMLSNDLR